MNGPVTTVAAVLTDGDRLNPRVLLTRRAGEPCKGQWCLPGGGISGFEPVGDAVRREVQEETGVAFEPLFFHYFNEIIPEKAHHHVLLVFAGNAVGTPTSRSSEVTELRWFTIDEALRLDLAFRNREVLQLYAERHAGNAAESGLLAEYSGLRAEIARRIGIRWQIEAFTMLFSTGFLAMSISDMVSDLLLLVVPCLVVLLAVIWAHNNLRIGELGRFIEQGIEPRCAGVRWERSLREAAGREPRWYVRRRVGVYAFAVFLLSALFMPIAAIAQGKLEVSFFSHLVLGVNLVLGLLIFLIIRFGRRAHEVPPLDHA